MTRHDADQTDRETRAGKIAALGVDSVLVEALSAMVDGFALYDPEGRLIFCNEACRRLYAVSAPAMVPGARFEDILRYGLERGQYPEAGASDAEREAWLTERIAHHRAGDRPIVQKLEAGRWLRIEERRLPSGHSMSIRSDVTGRVQAQADKARLGAIIERSEHEIFVLDPHTGRFTDVNEGARRNLGHSRDALLGMSPADINAEHDAEAIVDILAPLFDGSATRIELDTLHRRRDGSTYPCRISAYLDRSAEGDAVVAFGEDLTGERALEREVARGRRDLGNLLRNIPDIVTRARPDTVLFFVNERYREFLDLPDDAILGRSFLDFVPEEMRETIRAELAALTPEDPIRHSTETTMMSNEGVRTLRWSNLMVFEEGVPVEIISVGRDVTELHHANAALRAANDELQGFAYAASHDLRSPIQTMQSLLDVLREDHGDALPADAAMILDRLSNVAARMMQLSGSVLDYARLSGIPDAFETFDAGALVAGIVEDLGSEIAASGARIEIGDLPTIRGMRSRIGQVFQNLVGNAIKFRDPGRTPHIAVTALERPTEWSFSVRDNGIGLSPDEAVAVFAPFQRLHGRHRFAGTGLGLTICRKVVAAHGGEIAARPVPDGPGTIFTFTISKERP